MKIYYNFADNGDCITECKHKEHKKVGSIVCCSCENHIILGKDDVGDYVNCSAIEQPERTLPQKEDPRTGWGKLRKGDTIKVTIKAAGELYIVDYNGTDMCLIPEQYMRKNVQHGSISAMLIDKYGL